MRGGFHERMYYILPGHTAICQVSGTLNPKVSLIIEQFFPQIVNRHILTRSSVQSALEGLDRYRSMGYQAIGHFPEGEREENRKALDEAFAAAVRRLNEFHDQEADMTGLPAEYWSTDAS